MTYRKKMIEVALPLEAINVASAREKSIRHGHPSTLHLWWARRPLAACRAVLFASLVDDPDSDPTYAHYDAETRDYMTGEKRQQLFNLIEELVKWESSNDELIINAARAEIARCVASRKIELGQLQKDHKLRGGETVYDLVVKGHGDLPKLRAGTARLPNSESVNTFLADHAPPVVDPFAGGGSIPLEAQRLGLRVYASDLNPVPVLINKALIEIPPKFANKPPVNPASRGEAGPAGKKGKRKGKSVLGRSEWRGAEGLADDVRYYGRWMRDEAEKRIGHLYPKVKITPEMAKGRPDLKAYINQELTVIAWIWARTVASPNPAVGGVHVPLVRSFWLSTKKEKEAWLLPIVDQASNTYRFEVRVGSPDKKAEVDAGTKIGRGCKFKCVISDQPIPDTHVKQAGARDELGVRLLAIVAEGTNGRIYLSPVSAQEQTALLLDKPTNISAIQAPLANDLRNLWCLGYGLDRFDKLFTSRQLTTLVTFSDLVHEVQVSVLHDAKATSSLSGDSRRLEQSGDGPEAYAEAIATYLSLGVSKLADNASMLCSWHCGAQHQKIRSTFGRQALPMTWDYAEGNVFSDSTGNFWRQIELITEVMSTAFPPTALAGVVRQLDATAASSSNEPALYSSDPPYYDNIGYADLSDYFYLWLRRSLSSIYPSLFATLVTPKLQELIASPYRHEGGKAAAQTFFEEGLVKTFERMRERQDASFPTTIYYAFKQTETEEADGGNGSSAIRTSVSTGWETMLSGLVQAGFSVDGTWPIRTELANKIGMASNMLASSIVLSCRPRSVNASLAIRREFLNALKHELPDALRHMQRGSIAPVDLAQAAIGPGMAVFTRYAKVIEADGSAMSVRQALALINQTLDEVLAEQEGEFDSDTRWALAWFEQFGTDEGAFGVADVLARAKNTAVNGLVDAGIVAARGGKVRLLKRDELPADWNPATDSKIRNWEVAQHLIRALETGGEVAASDLLRKIGGMGEVARDLAYRLYNLCERKKWANEAMAYNGLVISWREISKLAQSSAPATIETQGEMF